MKTYIQLLLVTLFVPVLSACDQEDDVIDIFTGKTWYMTYIAVEGQNKMYDFWQGDQDAREKSFKTIAGDNYTLVFDGAEVNGTAVELSPEKPPVPLLMETGMQMVTTGTKDNRKKCRHRMQISI